MTIFFLNDNLAEEGMGPPTVLLCCFTCGVSAKWPASAEELAV